MPLFIVKVFKQPVKKSLKLFIYFNSFTLVSQFTINRRDEVEGEITQFHEGRDCLGQTALIHLLFNDLNFSKHFLLCSCSHAMLINSLFHVCKSGTVFTKLDRDKFDVMMQKYFFSVLKVR